MPLNLARLQKLKQRGDKITAQCPACLEAGADKKGQHLAIFADGRFACVAFQGDDAHAHEHRRRIFELAGLPASDAQPEAATDRLRAKPIALNWQACCERLLSDVAAQERLAAWRGWTKEFCHTLGVAGVIGLHERCVAFPVHDDSGSVKALHVFAWPGGSGTKAWYVNGGSNVPLLLGASSLQRDGDVSVCESQWDALSLLHAHGWQGETLDAPFVVTRGKAVHASLSSMLSGVKRVTLWPQNDAPKKDGTRPSETWLENIVKIVPAPVVSLLRVDMPDGAKDWNDVLRIHGPEETLRRVNEARSAARRAVHVTAPAASAEDLPAPEPLPSTLSPIAPFSDAWLPESLRGWISDIAERMQCPPEFPAVAAMVSLSAVAGRRFAIQPKEHDSSWFEHPHLWGMIVGRPSMMKSPAMQAAMGPMRRMEGDAFGVYRERERDRLAAELTAKLKRDALTSKAKKALGKGEEFDVSSLLDSRDGEMETLRRFIVNNASIEALGEVMKDNPNGVMLYQDELAGLLALMEKDGNADLRAFLLSAWNGKEGFTFDRIMRGMRRVEWCAISVLGGIQPGVVASRFREAQSEGQGDDGFMQRFSMMVWPDVSPDWRDVDRPPNRAREDEAFAVFQTMEGFTPAALQRFAPLNRDGVPVFRFAPNAQELFREWHAAHERRLRGDELPPALEAHLGKYRKLVPALAVLTHVAEWQGEGVSLAALQKALAWAACLETHAARAYGSRAVASAESARRLLKKIQSGTSKLDAEFTARDVKRKEWTGLGTPEEAKTACEMLAEYGWLLNREAGTTERGGRPTVLYRLNPRAQYGGMLV